MRTVVLGKISRGQHGRTASRRGRPMEFSDLLDVIAPEAIGVDPDTSLADLVMFPVSDNFDPRPQDVLEQANEHTEAQIEAPADEPPKVSRFADTGIDDDLLPVHAPHRRLHR